MFSLYGLGRVAFVFVVFVSQLLANIQASSEQDSQARANQLSVKIGESTGHYLYAPATGDKVSRAGYGLLVVLPGGDGSADFHPFVKRIQNNGTAGNFVLAQPIAKKWTADQHMIWPTKKDRSATIKYSTEELIASVVADVSKKTRINRKRIFLFGWSSSGPPIYSTMLQKKSPAVGAFVAMSVFKPDRLPPLTNGKGRSIYLLHSPNDKVCPYRMAKQANDALSKAGVRVKLVKSGGGHGWSGNVYGNIRSGIDWLSAPE